MYEAKEDEDSSEETKKEESKVDEDAIDHGKAAPNYVKLTRDPIYKKVGEPETISKERSGTSYGYKSDPNMKKDSCWNFRLILSGILLIIELLIIANLTWYK